MGRYRLKQRREWLGLTQAALAKEIGIKAYQVSFAEGGKAPYAVPHIRCVLASMERRKLDALAEVRRSDRNRAMAAAMPPSPQWEAFKRALLDRAWSLMDHGLFEEADAILEFVPDADRMNLFDEFFYDDASPPQAPEAANDEGANEARQECTAATSAAGGPHRLDPVEADTIIRTGALTGAAEGA